nr:hypothetical protein CFP56_69504 [Quercus suber]
MRAERAGCDEHRIDALLNVLAKSRMTDLVQGPTFGNVQQHEVVTPIAPYNGQDFVIAKQDIDTGSLE